MSLGQWRSYICILLVICVMSVPALAQVDQGRIAGTVKDQTGAVIPGVEITVRNDRTGEERKVVSADRGDYLVVALKPSQYTVFAELSGFAKAEVPGVQLVVGQTLTLDLTLKAAGITQELTVAADARNALPKRLTRNCGNASRLAILQKPDAIPIRESPR